MTERYYPAYIEFKKAGENRFFVTNRNDNKTHVLSSLEGELLMTLSGSRTIHEHLERIMESDRYDISGSALLEKIKSWIKKGFLREEGLLFSTHGDNTVVIDAKKEQKVLSGCITCDRPAMLDRWLGSRISCADYSERKTIIVICDQSKTRETIKTNRNIVNNYKSKYAGKIHYINEAEKMELAEKIAGMLPDDVPENLTSFSFAINQHFPDIRTPGSNRNALHLITAGFNLYTSDDDLEYRFFSKTNDNNSYYFPDKEILTTSFYPDMETMISELKIPGNYNLLYHFENLINSGISSLINQKKSVLFDNITPHIAMLQEKDLLKIRTVSAGYCGGRWYRNPYLPLLQEIEGRELFFYDYEKYNNIKNNGLNIISADKKTFGNGKSLMGGTFCVDNNNLLPPCFPLGMRDDTSFSILLSKCLEPGLTLHLPAALYHNPAEKPSFTPESFYEVSVNIGVYSTLILEKLTTSFIHPEGKERLRELGFYLQKFGLMRTSDFGEQLKLLQLGYLSKIMTNISYLLDLYEREPVWWAEDMDRYYALLKKEALGSNTVVPQELRSYETKEEALTVFKNYIYRYGEMLQWWPDIWEAARDINLEGRGIINLKE